MDSSRTFWEQRYRFVQLDPAPPSELAREAIPMLRARYRETGRRPVVLDLGAGGSQDAALLAERAGTVVAVDFVAGGMRHLPRTVHRVVADLREPLPFAGESFDFVYSHLVVSCSFSVAELQALFREVYRVLVPGGALWLLARSTDDPTCRRLGSRGPGYYPLAGAGLHFFSKKYLRRFLVGFEVEEISGVALQQHDEPYNAVVVRAKKD